ncbi:MAG: glycosyltransferase [Streptococcaceae bacterium]|nr:glycosyltransferase [Streptococcaceae bacterium]
METLQEFIYPKDSEFGSTEKYVRLAGDARFDDRLLRLNAQSAAQFDTYYNAFSMPLWQEKCTLENATLVISGRGRVKIELFHVNWAEKLPKKAALMYAKNGKINTRLKLEVLETREVDLQGESIKIMQLAVQNPALKGLVYPKITAVTAATVETLKWVTTDEKKRAVKLGISITHFNRKAYVLPAMRRIQGAFLSDPAWSEKIDFVVVDNSQNITQEEANGITIIPNENIGGSGGFMRGFMHYKKQGRTTHVLFMDDDASLEVESIKRAYTILEFAEKDNTVVGASLFYEQDPDSLMERGAYLRKRTGWWAKFKMVPSVEVKSLLLQEQNTERDDYAGWWFCAFPIKYVKHLTLPFFVRGDDISFGPLNDFSYIHANGIACLADDFEHKVSPMVEYLNLRNKLIVYALFIPNPFWAARNYLRWQSNTLVSLRFGYSDVLREACRDFISVTPEFLFQNIDMRNKVKQLNELAAVDALKPIDLTELPLAYGHWNKNEPIVTKVLRRASFNGIFLPRPLKKEAIIFDEWANPASYQVISGYKKILYYNSETQKGYVTEVNRKKVLRHLLGVLKDTFLIFRNLKKVRRRLLRELDYLTSEEIWEQIFQKKE